jgi:molybdate transport system ATP-binding protein
VTASARPPAPPVTASAAPPVTALAVDATVERTGRGGAFSFAISTRFERGITCVLGPSGAGKSTLLAIVSGLVTPTRGRVALGDEVWVDTAAAVRVPVERRHVAYLSQSLALFPHLDALGNIAYALAPFTPRAARLPLAHQLLARVGVAHLAHRRPRTYSGGEAQRVALARALAMRPRVILLDEPFSALDRELKIPLIALVRALVAEANVPAIAVTHSIGEARALADRVLKIAAGRVIADGTPAELLAAAGHDDDLALPAAR